VISKNVPLELNREAHFCLGLFHCKKVTIESLIDHFENSENTKKMNHYILPYQHITISTHHRIITSSYHHIIASSHHHITILSHYPISYSFIGSVQHYGHFIELVSIINFVYQTTCFTRSKVLTNHINTIINQSIE
jgi:hypothetical protein